MPIYEYRCDSCQRIISVYQRDFSCREPSCPHCGGSQLKRLFSTFSMRKTYKDVYEDILSDNNLTRGMINNDPRALAEWSKRMSGGEKVAPEYEEITGKMEGGEWAAKQIEEKRKEAAGEEGSKPDNG